MALGTGTHWSAPLLGDDKAGGGLYEEVPADILSRTHRSSIYYDFLDGQEFTTTINWTLTPLTAGTVAAAATGTNGQLLLNCLAVDAQGIGSFQNNVSAYTPSLADSTDGLASRVISAAARFSHSDFSVSNWFFGLAAADTTLMGTTGTLLTVGGDNCVGWHHVVDAVAQGGITGPDGNDVRMVSAGTAVANYQATLLSAAQVPLAAPANASIDGVMVEYGIKIIGTQGVEFYRNGILRHRRQMAVALTGPLTLSFGAVSNGTDENWLVDYVWASASR